MKRPPYLSVSQTSFENYFWLDSAGRVIAMDALAAGLITTSYEAVDILCLANQMHFKYIHEIIAADLRALGSTIDYKQAETESEMKRLINEAFELLGDNRMRAIFREAEGCVRQVLSVPEMNGEWLPWFLKSPVQ